MRRITFFILFAVWSLWTTSALAGPFTENGSQPPLSNNIEEPGACSACHGDYDKDNHLEPYPTWRGSTMALAGRDPLFWASLDVANNDVPDVGDFCLRCHNPAGWLAGRSEPPDGSADGCAMEGAPDQQGKDFSGVTCDLCHRMMTNEAPPARQEGYYTNNGQFWIDDALCPGGLTPCRRGPFDYDAEGTTPAAHAWLASPLHRESALCGNCHNVTSPALNLMVDGEDQGILFPVERTYAEWLASDFARDDSELAQSCQGCHMPTAAGPEAYASAFKTTDRSGVMGIHQFAGGNAWMPALIASQYPSLDRTEDLLAAAAASRAMLATAATVEVTDVTLSTGEAGQVAVRVTNKSGHKLPTGYPEGRRMWLHVTVRDRADHVVFESGVYDEASAELIEDEQIMIYRADFGVWDQNGTGECDIFDDQGRHLFHFAKANCVVFDNRILPAGFKAGDMETMPVGVTYPETEPGSGVLVNYDDVTYNVDVPPDAIGPFTVSAKLMYQAASDDYITFLRDQAVENGFAEDCFFNDGLTRGERIYQQWVATGKSAPDLVAEGIWPKSDQSDTDTDSMDGADSDSGTDVDTVVDGERAEDDGCGCQLTGGDRVGLVGLLL